MKKNKKVFGILTISLLMLSSCENQYFTYGGEGGLTTPFWISTKIKIKKTQEYNIKFELFYGAFNKKLFLESWNNNSLGYESTTGYFATKINIYNEDKNIIDTKYYEISDFLDKDKYLITKSYIPKGTADLTYYEYSNTLKYNYDFNNISVNNGYIQIKGIFYDTINNKEVDEEESIEEKRLFEDTGYLISFEKSNNKIIF